MTISEKMELEKANKEKMVLEYESEDDAEVREEAQSASRRGGGVLRAGDPERHGGSKWPDRRDDRVRVQDRAGGDPADHERDRTLHPGRSAGEPAHH